MRSEHWSTLATVKPFVDVRLACRPSVSHVLSNRPYALAGTPVLLVRRQTCLIMLPEVGVAFGSERLTSDGEPRFTLLPCCRWAETLDKEDLRVGLKL